MRLFPRLLMGLVEQVIPQTQTKHSATVILFHGSGKYISVFKTFHVLTYKILKGRVPHYCLMLDSRIMRLFAPWSYKKIVSEYCRRYRTQLHAMDQLLDREEVRVSTIKLIFPTAPVQPYTPLNGGKSWLDRITSGSI